MSEDITISSWDDWWEFRSRATDIETIGRIVARVVESQSQRAFLEQKLGDIPWPERYPGMDDPFVNLAALVNWTNDGGSILPRFFDRRPALMGEGRLSGSISAERKGDLIELGSKESYAAFHQWGGTSTQPITEATKKTVGRFLGEEKVDGKWQKKKSLGSKQAKQREKYYFRLMPLLHMDQMETQINQRPFLGITEDNEQEMVDTIEAYVAHGKEG